MPTCWIIVPHSHEYDASSLSSVIPSKFVLADPDGFNMSPVILAPRNKITGICITNLKIYGLPPGWMVSCVLQSYD